MSDDLIRRSDAINFCEKWRSRTNEHHDKNGWYIADAILKAIKELPSADRPQGEWTPCSERLPKESGQYFVTAGIEQRQVAKGYYSAEYERWYAVSDVSAWMPLPEPWKGADDETD